MSSTVSIYVSDEGEATFEKARELVGRRGLSALVVDLVTDWVRRQETCPWHDTSQVLEVRDVGGRRARFRGAWLVSPVKGAGLAAALTANDRIMLYRPEEWWFLYESFAELEADEDVPRDFVYRVSRQLSLNEPEILDW